MTTTRDANLPSLTEKTQVDIMAELPWCGHKKVTLQEQRDFLSNVVNNIEALVVILDKNGRIIRYNKACERFVDLGAQILKVALDYVDLIQCGISHIEAIRILKTREGDYNPDVVNIFGENEILINSYTVKKGRCKFYSIRDDPG
jgi:transcriptional regulator with PAS, ATPase and Fis domain